MRKNGFTDQKIVDTLKWTGKNTYLKQCYSFQLPTGSLELLGNIRTMFNKVYVDKMREETRALFGTVNIYFEISG